MGLLSRLVEVCRDIVGLEPEPDTHADVWQLVEELLSNPDEDWELSDTRIRHKTRGVVVEYTVDHRSNKHAQSMRLFGEDIYLTEIAKETLSDALNAYFTYRQIRAIGEGKAHVTDFREIPEAEYKLVEKEKTAKCSLCGRKDILVSNFCKKCRTNSKIDFNYVDTMYKEFQADLLKENNILVEKYNYDGSSQQLFKFTNANTKMAVTVDPRSFGAHNGNPLDGFNAAQRWAVEKLTLAAELPEASAKPLRDEVAQHFDFTTFDEAAAYLRGRSWTTAQAQQLRYHLMTLRKWTPDQAIELSNMIAAGVMRDPPPPPAPVRLTR